MTILLVDIGNSRVKWGVGDCFEIIAGVPIAHRQLKQTELMEAWQTISQPNKIVVSCVGSKRVEVLIRSVSSLLWPKTAICFVQSRHFGYGVTNGYTHPEKLGVDRWLSLVAAHKHYPGYTCVVDCGTAITIDLIDPDGLHQGGYICPGLMLMKRALFKGTEALPLIQKSSSFGPGKNTEVAISSGTLLAVKGLISQIRNIHPNYTNLILTGGDAEMIGTQLDYDAIVDNNLILRGLAIVAAEIT